MDDFINLTEFFRGGPITIRRSDISAVWRREASMGVVCAAVLVCGEILDVAQPYDDVIAKIRQTFIAPSRAGPADRLPPDWTARTKTS